MQLSDTKILHLEKKRKILDAGSQDLFNTALLINNMYQRTFDVPTKEFSFKSMDKALNHNTVKNNNSSTYTFIYTAQGNNKSSSTSSNEKSDDIDDLLSRLESLDLNKSVPLYRSKIATESLLSVKNQLIRNKRLVNDAYDTLIHPLFGEDFESLLEATTIPISTGVEELTEEENKIVDDIFKMHQTGIVSQFKTAIVEYKDIYKLYPETWLNDEIINFYMQLLTERSNKQPSANFPTIHCFNTFFCSTLRDQGYDKVRRWTKKVDIFSKDLLLIPINRSYHWTLGAIDMMKRTITIYDSLNGKHDSTIQLFFNYLEMEHMDKKKKPFDKTGWIGITPSNVPQQQNMSDCGVFTCMFAERLSRNRPFDFTQKDMTAIRRRMALDIKRKKLSA